MTLYSWKNYIITWFLIVGGCNSYLSSMQPGNANPRSNILKVILELESNGFRMSYYDQDGNKQEISRNSLDKEAIQPIIQDIKNWMGKSMEMSVVISISKEFNYGSLHKILLALKEKGIKHITVDVRENNKE